MNEPYYLINANGKLLGIPFGDFEIVVNRSGEGSNQGEGFYFPTLAKNVVLCSFSVLFDGSVSVSKETSLDIPIWVNGFRVPQNSFLALSEGDVIVFGSLLYSYRLCVTNDENTEITGHEHQPLDIVLAAKQILEHGDISLVYDDVDSNCTKSIHSADSSEKVVHGFIFSEIMLWLRILSVDVSASHISISNANKEIVYSLNDKACTLVFKASPQVTLSTVRSASDIIELLFSSLSHKPTTEDAWSIVCEAFSKDAQLSIKSLHDNVTIRLECEADIELIHAVVVAAFPTPAEADLVDRLRCDGDVAYSLVAVVAGNVIGHILFSKMTAPFRALGLAPVAVHPQWQRREIGSRLIRDGLSRAKADGYEGVFVLGSTNYYPRFGFDVRKAKDFSSPYAGSHFMVMSLQGDELPVSSGAVEYPEAFKGLG